MWPSVYLTISLFLANVSIITSIDNELIMALLTGVTLNASGTAIRIGLVTVPFDTLCKVPLTARDACRLCMLDCTVVHKATSGKCAPHPSRSGETTCLCNYTPAKPRPSVTSVCKASYSPNIFDLDFVDNIFDSQAVLVLRARFELVLCSTLNGCKVDCINNHGAKTGTCSNGYCVCNY